MNFVLPSILMKSAAGEGGRFLHSKPNHSLEADMPYVFGIDISAFAVPNDWKAVSNQGVKFVFVKASENGLADATFSVNWQGAKAVGILRRAYDFFHPQAGNAAASASNAVQTF